MKNKLKLLLLSMMFIGLGLSFCSSEDFFQISKYRTSTIGPGTPFTFNGGCLYTSNLNCFRHLVYYSNGLPLFDGISSSIQDSRTIVCSNLTGIQLTHDWSNMACSYYIFSGGELTDIFSSSSSCPEPEPSSINVLYNNENSTTNITCNGDNVIQIDGLSTITATNKFTPYFNIDYRDENNQSLTESYSKNILYLSGTLFKKTFTGDNERILTSQGNNNSNSFSGYVPTFDVVFTGDTFNDTGNVFNNFAQNSLQVALSNIPSYIQYVIIIMLLFFILGLVRRKKRR